MGSPARLRSTPHGPEISRRYRLRFELRNPDRFEQYWAVTAFGELKAAVMAAGHADKDGLWVSRIELLSVEDEFEIDPERDLLDYWEVA
jgi:hypothetical protein